MVVFERYIPWMIYAEDRDIWELYFTVPNRPGQLKKTLDVLAQHNVNVLNVNAYSLPGWERAPVFLFADFTGLNLSIERVKKELELVTGSKVYVKSSPVKGFMMDEFAFPLFVFPGVRSLVILERDFQEMVKGLYRRMGDAAAVFLYHLAFSGGKFLAEYLSRKLGLRGRELLAETLKAYQAGGWGRVELVRYEPYTMSIVLRLYDSVECKIFKGSSKPASQFIRGHLSGLLSGLLKASIRVMESRCIAMGDPYCEFYAEKV